MTTTLSEAESKELLGAYGLPLPLEHLVCDAEAAVSAAENIRYPCVAVRAADMGAAVGIAAALSVHEPMLGPRVAVLTIAGGGRFADLDSIERVSAFHERQDRRYAEAIVECSTKTATPVVAATELSIADPSNPGPATLREHGHPCYSSPGEAVAALTALYERGRSRGPIHGG